MDSCLLAKVKQVVSKERLFSSLVPTAGVLGAVGSCAGSGSGAGWQCLSCCQDRAGLRLPCALQCCALLLPGHSHPGIPTITETLTGSSRHFYRRVGDVSFASVGLLFFPHFIVLLPNAVSSCAA